MIKFQLFSYHVFCINLKIKTFLLGYIMEYNIEGTECGKTLSLWAKVTNFEPNHAYNKNFQKGSNYF